MFQEKNANSNLLAMLEAVLGERLPRKKEPGSFPDGAIRSLQNGDEEMRMVIQDGDQDLVKGSDGGEEVVVPPLLGVENLEPPDSHLEIMTQVGWMEDTCEVDEKKKAEQEHERTQPKLRMRSKTNPLEAPPVPQSALEASVVGGDMVQPVNPAEQLQLIEPKVWI